MSDNSIYIHTDIQSVDFVLCFGKARRAHDHASTSTLTARYMDAATPAISGHTSMQDIPVTKLQKALQKGGAILHLDEEYSQKG
jgi:hypothetical protein